MAVDGVLIVDKPPGMTSHDVVARVRRTFGTRKVGHAGTLDPDATGVLIIGLGRATRFLSYSQAIPKRYRAVAQFGSTTSTQDASGEILSMHSCEGLDEDSLVRACGSFVGDIEQVPPMVSAVKIGGERLYRKARRGEEIERPPRPVTIYKLSIAAFEPGAEPQAVLDVTCSAGTYVRTLVHDLGQAMGCGAHLASLRRTEAGGFSEADAVGLDAVDPSTLRPLEAIVHSLARLDLDEQDALAVANGKPLAAPPGMADGELRALFAQSRLLAVYKRYGESLKAETVVGDIAGRQ